MRLHHKALSAALLLTAATVGSPAFAQTCAAKHKFSTVEEGFLTVAAVNYAPYSIVGDDGNVTGIDGEILDAVAEMECLKVKTVAVDAAAAIQYVLTKKSDTASGDWYRTAERAKVLNLSEPLYLDQMAIYSAQGWGKISDLEGRSVGALQGSLWDADLKTVLGDNLKLYPTAAGATQDLTAGRIEAFVEGTTFGAIAKTKGELKEIKIIPVLPDGRIKASVGAGQACFVTVKDNTDLMKAIDEDLKELKKSGETEKLLIKYGLPASAAKTGAASLIK